MPTTGDDASPIAVAERFLAALSAPDMDAMFAGLAPDVTCVFPTAPGDGPRVVQGKDANRALFAGLRPMWRAFRLTRRQVHALAGDPDRVVAEFASEGTLVEGSAYANTYVALVTIRDGKIRRWEEFADPAPIQRGIMVLQQQRASP